MSQDFEDHEGGLPQMCVDVLPSEPDTMVIVALYDALCEDADIAMGEEGIGAAGIDMAAAPPPSSAESTSTWAATSSAADFSLPRP